MSKFYDSDQTYYLVESKAFPLQGRWWATIHDGCFVNKFGGFFPTDGGVVIETSPGPHDKLDWSGTYLCKKDSSTGWLDPEGVYHGCPSEAHCEYAECFFGMGQYEAEEAGYIKIVCDPASLHRPGRFSFFNAKELTQKQREWLVNNKHQVPSNGKPNL